MQTLGDPRASSPAPTGTPPPAARYGRHLELVLLLAGTLGVSLWSVRSGGAPAVVAALLGVMPAVVALQHGLIAGLVGVLFAAASVGFAPTREALQTLLAPMLAPFTLALAVGAFSDRARRARQALRERASEQARQLEQLFRTYHVLRSSHAQLEERLAAREWSLDAAVREAGRQIGARDLAGAAAALLELLAAQGRVGSAALYMARRGVLPVQPDACLGSMVESGEVPELVALAFARGSMASLEREQAAAQSAEVLLAFPLITTGGHVVGVVAVHELPFVAFHEAHFRLLSTLIAPFTDALARKAEGTEAIACDALPPPTRAVARLRAALLAAPRRHVEESVASSMLHAASTHAVAPPERDDARADALAVVAERCDDACAAGAESLDDDEPTQHRMGSPRLVRL